MFEYSWQNKRVTDSADTIDDMTRFLLEAADELRKKQDRGVTLDKGSDVENDFAALVKTKRNRGFITIIAGVLVASIDYEEVWSRKATRKAAVKLGKWIAKNAPEVRWCYSSSIDFPQDDGAPRINFRVAIAEGLHPTENTVFDPINGGKRP